MKGRTLAWVVAALLVAALVAQGSRWHDRLLGSALLLRVELVSISAKSSGRVPPNLLALHLELLRQAAELDPAEVAVPIARANQYLLFGDPRGAIPAYQEALHLEPKPIIYFGLGKAYLAMGDAENARRNFQLAVRLDPFLAGQLPEGYR